MEIKFNSNSKSNNSKLNENQYNFIQISSRINLCTRRINNLTENDSVEIEKISKLLDEISSMIHNYEEMDSSNENKDNNISNKRKFILHDKYRTLQNLYFTSLSKISIDKIEKIRNESENSIKEISNNMIINIAAIFLGISLVSAMVQGIYKIPSEMLLTYFMGNGAIILSILGICAIFFRKVDKKTWVILLICIIYLGSFIAVAINTYNNTEIPNNQTDSEEIYQSS